MSMEAAQRYVEKTRTWDDNWNDVIRYEIFQDTTLKEQMCVPEKTPIMDFILNYFIEDASTDQLLTDEKVRVVHYDEEGFDTTNKNVFIKYKVFDIYVKKNYLYTATNDRLKSRCILIAERIKYLLLKNPYIHGLRFKYKDAYDMWTKTIGYQRYHLVFSYKITV